MPIGRFPDWDACIAWAREHDIDDPEAYCGALERQATQGSNMTHVALVAPEGVRTSDRRLINPGALSWREGAPLMFIDKTTEGHDEAQHVGNLSNFRRATVDGETWLVADLAYDSDEQAREAQRLADEGKISGVSADIGAVTADLEILEVGEDGMPVDWLETISEGEVLGATQLPMPAFAGARILSVLDFQALTTETITAALNPKATASWFVDPELVGPTPLTVTDDGRVFGHLATWGTCHVGFEGACVTPPESQTDYAYFNLGCVSIDGEEIPCGHITLGTGHAQLSADAESAARHYDDTGSCVADVVAGEDKHGIWVSGATRPGVDIDALRSASLSGDWRRVGGQLELVAALAVNVPGFPVPRVAARVASGEQTVLVASGVVEQRSRDDLIYEALRLLTDEVRAMRGGFMVDVATDTVIEDVAIEEAPHGRLAAILDATG